VLLLLGRNPRLVLTALPWRARLAHEASDRVGFYYGSRSSQNGLADARAACYNMRMRIE
jgi:hypothetical protein